MNLITSKEDFENARGHQIIQLKCQECLKCFERTKRELRFYKRRGGNNFNYCSKQCSDESKRLNHPKECAGCKKIFSPSSKDTIFCERKCYNANRRTKIITFSCKRCLKGATMSLKEKNENAFYRKGFCSSVCKNGPEITCEETLKKYKVKTASFYETKNCDFCKKEFLRPKNKALSKHGKVFCNRSCSAKHFTGKTKISRPNHTSRAEVMTLDFITKDFPDLQIITNDRSVLPSGLELDLFFPDIKFAIELNGPTHYMPIYGEKALEHTKFKDSKKFAEAHALKISLLVVDISKCKSKVQTIKFVTNYYLEVLKPLLELKIKDFESLMLGSN